MILTITLNPSVDISYKLEAFNPDTANRVSNVSKTAGGKGLNVSRVIQQLGENVAASGFLGGSLGQFIRKEISEQSIEDLFVNITGDTRNCIAVIHEGQQTEILEAGPTINENEETEFLNNFSEDVQKIDYVIISGSLPKGLTKDFYACLIKIGHQYDTPVLLDTKGELLHHTLESNSKPFLIKPNKEELADLLGEKVTDDAQIVSALQSQTFAGVTWVVVTTGSTGAIVKHNEEIYQLSTPEVDAVNPVGSGDSVIAGFAVGLSRGLSDEELVKYALTMGVLNALETQTGSINTDKVDWYKNQIRLERI